MKTITAVSVLYILIILTSTYQCLSSDMEVIRDQYNRNRNKPFLHFPKESRHNQKPNNVGDFFVDDEDDFIEFPKRQTSSDDYGHLRFGKRGEDSFDDYGHMRFGRRELGI